MRPVVETSGFGRAATPPASVCVCVPGRVPISRLAWRRRPVAAPVPGSLGRAAGTAGEPVGAGELAGEPAAAVGARPVRVCVCAAASAPCAWAAAARRLNCTIGGRKHELRTAPASGWRARQRAGQRARPRPAPTSPRDAHTQVVAEFGAFHFARWTLAGAPARGRRRPARRPPGAPVGSRRQGQWPEILEPGSPRSAASSRLGADAPAARWLLAAGCGLLPVACGPAACYLSAVCVPNSGLAASARREAAPASRVAQLVSCVPAQRRAVRLLRRGSCSGSALGGRASRRRRLNPFCCPSVAPVPFSWSRPAGPAGADARAPTSGATPALRNEPAPSAAAGAHSTGAPNVQQDGRASAPAIWPRRVAQRPPGALAHRRAHAHGPGALIENAPKQIRANA